MFRSSPIFGVEYEEEKKVESATPTTEAIPEDVEVVNTASDTLAVRERREGERERRQREHSAMYIP